MKRRVNEIWQHWQHFIFAVSIRIWRTQNLGTAFMVGRATPPHHWWKIQFRFSNFSLKSSNKASSRWLFHSFIPPTPLHTPFVLWLHRTRNEIIEKQLSEFTCSFFNFLSFTLSYFRIYIFSLLLLFVSGSWGGNERLFSALCQMKFC